MKQSTTTSSSNNNSNHNNLNNSLLSHHTNNTNNNPSEGEGSTIEANPDPTESKRMGPDGATLREVSKRSHSSVQVGVLVEREVDKLTKASRMLRESEEQRNVREASPNSSGTTSGNGTAAAGGGVAGAATTTTKSPGTPSRSGKEQAPVRPAPLTSSSAIAVASRDEESKYEEDEGRDVANGAAGVAPAKTGAAAKGDDTNTASGGIPVEIPLFDRSEVQAWTLLGNGAFSEVYQVWDFRLDETIVTGNPLQDQARQQLKDTAMDEFNRCNYVIKHLRNDLLGPDKSRFVHAASDLVMEALFLSKLDHPNIIKLRGTSRGIDTFGDGEHDGFFLILDRLDCTLSDKIGQWARHSSCRRKIYSRNLYDYHDKIDIALQIARGLDFLHDRDIIYRDLKPDNIGIQNRTVKIFDFGLCRELPEECPVENKVFHMSGVGTRRYMAPEIFLTQHYNLKVDVYSFAIVLHCMLSLARPFEKYNAQLHTLLVCKEGVRPPIPHEWPPELRDLLRYGWAHRPSDRPSIKEARQTLERLAQRVEAEGVPPSPKYSDPLLSPRGGGQNPFMADQAQLMVDRVCTHPINQKAGKLLRRLERQLIRGVITSYPGGLQAAKAARAVAAGAPRPKPESAQYRKHLRSAYRL